MMARMSRAFFITLGFFILIFCFLTFGKDIHHAVAFNEPAWKQQVGGIDEQIQQLEEMKRGYEGRALRHENLAQRLQFQQDELLTARRHWQLAKENREIAEKVQVQIDQLQQKKKSIFEKHNYFEKSE